MLSGEIGVVENCVSRDVCAPTAEPTEVPSDGPTRSPVTGEPSAKPTPAPVTDAPTISPVVPTPDPTGSPSCVHTYTNLTITDAPTTAEPTDSPTKQPTSSPTGCEGRKWHFSVWNGCTNNGDEVIIRRGAGPLQGLEVEFWDAVLEAEPWEFRSCCARRNDELRARGEAQKSQADMAMEGGTQPQQCEL